MLLWTFCINHCHYHSVLNANFQNDFTIEMNLLDKILWDLILRFQSDILYCNSPQATEPGPRLNIKTYLRMAISMLKIRRPLGCLIFNMGIAIPGKTVFLIETAPWFIFFWLLTLWWISTPLIINRLCHFFTFLIYLEPLALNFMFCLLANQLIPRKASVGYYYNSVRHPEESAW